MNFWSLCPSFPLYFLPGSTGGEEGIRWHMERRCSHRHSFLPWMIMLIFNQIMKGFLKWFLIPRRQKTYLKISLAIANNKSGVQTEPGSHQFLQLKRFLSGRLKGPQGSTHSWVKGPGPQQPGVLSEISVEFPGWLATDSPKYHKKNLSLKDKFIRLNCCEGNTTSTALEGTQKGEIRGGYLQHSRGLAEWFSAKQETSWHWTEVIP